MALTKIRGTTQVMDLSLKNQQIAADAAIELSKLQDGNLLVKTDGSTPFTAPQAGITPTAANHLTTKGYVDGLAQGLDVKGSVRAMAAGNIALSGTQVVDGVSLQAGDRVLVVGQTNGSENGIYTVESGPWTRAADADSNSEVTSGLFTFVSEGTANGGTGWILTTADSITVGITPLTFTQFSSAGVISAGSGLSQTGTTLSVASADPANITVGASGINLAPAGTAGTYASVTTDAYGRVISGSATQGWDTITGAPTTLAGYGITDAQPADAGLASLAALDGTGFVVADGAGNFTTTALTAGPGISVAGGEISNTGIVTLSGTVNQVTIEGSNGNFTLSLPQDIAVTSNPTFAGVTLTGTPSNDTDAATKAYVDQTVTGAIAASVVAANSTIQVTPQGIKLQEGTAGQVLVADAAGVFQPVSLAGAVTIDQAGATTLSAGAVTLGKIEALANGNIIIGSASGNVQVPLSSLAITLANFTVRETPTGAVNGTNAAFALSKTPVAGTEQVYVNGLFQSAGASEDYVISGNTITFTFNPELGDKIRVTYVAA